MSICGVGWSVSVVGFGAWVAGVDSQSGVLFVWVGAGSWVCRVGCEWWLTIVRGGQGGWCQWPDLPPTVWLATHNQKRV